MAEMNHASSSTDEQQKQNASAPQEEQKHRSLGARIIFSLAFLTVGAKLSLVGMLADGAKLMQGEGSFWSKARGLQAKLGEQVMEHLPSNRWPTTWEFTKAYSKVFKFTLIATAVGSVIGAVLGWVRGGRIEHVGDIIHHPIRSTKIILGIGQSEKAAAKESTPDETLQQEENKPPRSRNIQPRGSYTQAAVKEETSSAAFSR